MAAGFCGAMTEGRMSSTSEIRTSAPEALKMSPLTSPSSRAEDAASIDSASSCSSTPPVIWCLTNTASADG